MLPSEVLRLATDSPVRVFPGVWELLSFLRLPSWDGSPSLSLLSFFLSFIFSPTSFQRDMGCFSGCLMSSTSIQKLFCGIYSAFKYSFCEFVGEKVVSPSYSFAIFCVSPDAKSRARCPGPAMPKEQIKDFLVTDAQMKNLTHNNRSCH